MAKPDKVKWPLGINPGINLPFADSMQALVIHRDRYGPPERFLNLEETPAPRLRPEDATRVLVAVLATGPNFNTNFASLGLPVPVFGRGDSSTTHIPGSDAVGIVLDAGAGVRSVKVGQAVILDSWTLAHTIRGYETHDGFNAQFAVVEQERAIAVPDELKARSPEQLAAMLLTYGTAYRAVVERLDLRPGESILLMGGGKGTSFAGAQIAKALGARVILMGSNPDLAQSLVHRGIADAFVDRRQIPPEAFGVIPEALGADEWLERTAAFRRLVLAANEGRPVDAVFEHTGGRNFPLLVSALAENGRLAFFGATGGGLKGEYKQSFFYGRRRLVMDARWVWMRQKQILFRNARARDILAEIRLPAGRRGLIWGADAYALEFARAALERRADIGVIASRSGEPAGIQEMQQLGVSAERIIDRDRFDLPADMPDPLTDEGGPNPDYGRGYMNSARALGKAVWEIFGPRLSPDFIVERPDQSTLHFSTFLARDFNEQDEMPSSFIVAHGPRNLSILGSHMYRSSQAREAVRLLARNILVMEKADLEVTDLAGLPRIQQKMLAGRMGKPKGAALVQADRPGRSVASFEEGYLGDCLIRPDARKHGYIGLHVCANVGILSICREQALNALNHDLVRQIAEVVAEIKKRRRVRGQALDALILRGSGRAFVAGADVTEFHGSPAERIAAIALANIRLFADIENLKLPVIALLDGFVLGGGNELAMSAHYRIVTENALIGQPEVKLGIIPGYGGLQRLPRLVGPAKAAEMSINGEPIDGREAVRLGLADEFAPASTALLAAFRAAQAFAAGRRRLVRKDWDAIAGRQQRKLKVLLKEPAAAELLAAPEPAEGGARDLAAARRNAGRFVLRAIAFGYANGFKRGLRNDAKLFGQVAASPSGQEWIGRFLEKDPRQSSFLTIFPSMDS